MHALSRRHFLRFLGAAPLALACGRAATRVDPGERVNDVHAQLNPTWVDRVIRPTTLEDVQRVVREARDGGHGLAIAGSRHAMGGQQFLTDGWLLDTRGLDRIGELDAGRGLIPAGAGVQWPPLIERLATTWGADGSGWGIIQKQTGADWLTLGGALAANVHGRVLTRPPIVGDVESFVLVDAEGEARRVSRTADPELFALAIGGYGLFGVITEVQLRLAPRQKVRRSVEEAVIEDVSGLLARRIAEGHTYGDFQFGIDAASDADFLRRGVLSTYRPVPLETPIPAEQRTLSEDDWRRLLVFAHTDPGAALEAYLAHYLATDGQVYWADTQQLGFYLPDYHRALDAGLGTGPATEVITELYVPRERLADFMLAAREDLRRRRVQVVYGTVRLIERDTETFLPWAKGDFACVIFNLHTPHDRAGMEASAAAFRDLIDRALERDGSFYLTYHRFATRDQLERAYPRFEEFLQLKRERDPDERFRSDWFEHVRGLFG